MIRTGVLRDTLKRRGVQANTDAAERCFDYMIRVNQIWREKRKEAIDQIRKEVINAIRQVEKLFWPKMEPEAAEPAPAREEVNSFTEDPRRSVPDTAHKPVDKVEEFRGVIKANTEKGREILKKFTGRYFNTITEEWEDASPFELGGEG